MANISNSAFSTAKPVLIPNVRRSYELLLKENSGTVTLEPENSQPPVSNQTAILSIIECLMVQMQTKNNPLHLWFAAIIQNGTTFSQSLIVHSLGYKSRRVRRNNEWFGHTPSNSNKFHRQYNKTIFIHFDLGSNKSDIMCCNRTQATETYRYVHIFSTYFI